ncbi:transcription termination/antitermination protein NusG [Mesorhizobium sp. A556]
MKAAIDKGLNWYVVRANIKSETKAANNLRLAGFDVYYPRQRYETKNKRTHIVREHERPLMMRYLFVGMPKGAGRQHFGFARACEGVESIVGPQGTPVIVPAKDIEAIFLAEIDMRFDDTRAARIHRKEEARTKKETVRMVFKEGTQVDVLGGPFASFSGVVEEVTSSGKVEALVAIFGRWSKISFDPEQLSPAA